MTPEQPRTVATGREHSPPHYSLTIEQAADLYAKAGHPRTFRAVQKYCALSKLDCRKVETETGEKYLVAPYSVERHIAYINEVRTAANGRDRSRIDANVREQSRTEKSVEVASANSDEQPRTDATGREQDGRYLEALERENGFLREQITVKDSQIKDLTERARETNHLIAGLQKMLTPLLGSAGETQDHPNRG
ncbi:MAG: hypothetical protein IT539_04465 [Bradyrhizobiaceae bacterium]|nr:hypothetical protein [Bradyrhizobiaceae bacterium]